MSLKRKAVAFNNKSKYLIYRRISQVGLGVIFTNSFTKVWWTKEIYQGPLKAFCIPGLNCHACPMATLSCPIGILQYHMATHTFPFLLLGYIALIGVLFGRAACGWICPFGWIQDMIMKIKARKFRIPKVLNKLKWVILPSLAVVLPYYTGVHWFSKLCPYGALIGGIPWALWNPIDPVLEAPVIEPGSFGAWFVIKMIILAFFLGWFALSKRPFCRTTCPMGLIFSWFNRISLLKIEIKVRCPDCALCNALCPMDLKVNEEIESENCIKCLDCTACRNVQTKFSLRYGFTRKKPSPEEIPVIPS